MKCLYPVRLYRDGQWRSVPCGHCKSCLNLKARKYSTMCDLESRENKWSFFITLTYSPEYLPRVEAFVGKKVVYPGERNPFASTLDGAHRGVEVNSVQFISKCPRLTNHYKSSLIDEVIDNPNRHYAVSDYLRPFENGAFSLENPYEMGVLSIYDLQLFFKRLRYYLQSTINKINKENGKEEEKVRVRYFGVGEYGPKRFRPHYHAMCYISQPQVAEIFSECVHKAWTYGRVDCQLSATGEANGYVSKYINSLGYVPACLRTQPFRPFCLHSTYFGVDKNAELEKSLDELVYREFVERVYSRNGRLVEYSAPLSIQLYLFPKCYRYGKDDDFLHLVRYQFLEYLRSAYIRDFFVQECVDDALRDAIREIPVSVLAEYYCERRPLIAGYESEELFPGKATLQSFRSRILSALGISKRFLMLCDLYRTSPWFYYNNIIKEFYLDKDYCNLRDSLQQMELDFKKSDLDPATLIYRYDNLPRAGDNPCTVYDVDRYMRFACFARSIDCDPVRVMEIYDSPEKDPEYIRDFSLSSKIFNDSMKHKVQNDINKVLYG